MPSRWIALASVSATGQESVTAIQKMRREYGESEAGVAITLLLRIGSPLEIE
jgi:hypothetical protein